MDEHLASRFLGQLMGMPANIKYRYYHIYVLYSVHVCHFLIVLHWTLLSTGSYHSSCICLKFTLLIPFQSSALCMAAALHRLEYISRPFSFITYNRFPSVINWKYVERDFYKTWIEKKPYIMWIRHLHHDDLQTLLNNLKLSLKIISKLNCFPL